MIPLIIQTKIKKQLNKISSKQKKVQINNNKLAFLPETLYDNASYRKISNELGGFYAVQ